MIGDLLFFEAVSPQDFTIIQRFRESNNHKYRFERYYSDCGLLIITIPTHYQGCMHVYVFWEITEQMTPMGLKHDLFPLVGTTFFIHIGLIPVAVKNPVKADHQSHSSSQDAPETTKRNRH